MKKISLWNTKSTYMDKEYKDPCKGKNCLLCPKMTECPDFIKKRMG